MSFVAWLDHSTEDERRVREMIRLFDQPETQDALGFGQVRDAYGDLLFPGTSTLHTRAKYLLFIPWCSITAAARGYTGERLERASRDNERRLIQTLSSMPDVRGLIGGRRGWTVRNLPSGTYGTALERWHIRGNEDQTLPSPDDDGELVDATHGWHRRLPAPPIGFPERAPGAFTLTYAEAEYLQGRLLSIDGPQSLFTYLADRSGPAIEAPRLWAEPAIEHAPPHIKDDVRCAQTFSTISHGANLLYNYLVARKYEKDGWTTIENPVERYEVLLDEWADTVRELGAPSPWRHIRTRAADQNPNVLHNMSLDAFAETWFESVAGVGPHAVWRSESAQKLVREREISIKKLQSRFTNPTMLSRWGGSSGAGAFEYRWPQARGLLNDIATGLRGEDLAVA